uniref:MYG1 family protein n=1 Tax=candidate division CPR3 bacterium TaxID=2268181 RepID=A0A7C4R2R8_UNCC3
MKQKEITVVFHSGVFHADDVFAAAILKKVYPNLKTIRSRDDSIIKKADLRVDVGRKYDPKTGDFDHHQENAPVRDSGIPYSSCGLIWKHFGKKIVKDKEAFDYINKKIIEFIDSYDNGIEITGNKTVVYSIGELIDSFNPSWNEKNLEDLYFKKAVLIASKILNREIKKANSISEGNNIVKEALKKAKDGFVILPIAGLPKDLITKDKKILFYIAPGKNKDWVGVGASAKESGFERKAYFPKKWAGLENKELEKASGVVGARFCHKARFMVAGTKEAVIEMVKKST